MPKKYIKLSEETTYKDLAPIFEELYVMFLDKTRQLIDKEDEEARQTLVALNLRDLKRNKKPEGFNRGDGMRLVFPIIDGPIELYVRGSREHEVDNVTEIISGFLDLYKIENRTEWDMSNRWDI